MKNFIKITFVSLCLSAVFLVGCGPDETITPKNDTTDPGDTTTAIEEYIEIKGIRVNGSEFGRDFAERKFAQNGAGLTELSVVFDKDGIPGTDFRWMADSTMFKEGEYNATQWSADSTAFGFGFVGYVSGTGKFIAKNASETEYDSCVLKKKNGKWYLEVKNLLMYDLKGDFEDIRVSARIIWQDYNQ